MTTEEQTASPEPFDPLAPDLSKDSKDPSKYTPQQKVALTAGMFKQIGEDLGAFAKGIVANDVGNGYLLSYEDVAIFSAKLLRAKTGVSSIARIFEAALPKDVSVDETVASVKTDVKNMDGILSSLQEAVLSNKVLASDVPAASVK